MFSHCDINLEGPQHYCFLIVTVLFRTHNIIFSHCDSSLADGFKPSSKLSLLTIPRCASFVDHLCYFCLFLLCFHAGLFVDALWSSAGKELTSWLSFVMSNCDIVTFPLVSLVRCGA